MHKAASGAFPFPERIPPERFVKLLAAGEIAVGSALLAPVVPSALAGAALTGFSGSLLAMYLRTPALHKPGWPGPPPQLDLLASQITERLARARLPAN